jgi:hypothetical protein
MVVDVALGNEFDVLINKDPQAAEVWTLLIDAAVNSTEYGVDLTSPVTDDVSYTSDASATVAEIANGLAAAWNAAPIARGYAAAVSNGVDTIVFTGTFPGIVFAMAEDEAAASMTLTNTTDADTADAVPFGRAMISLGYESNENDRLGILAKSTSMTAQVDTLTVTYAAGEIYSVSITIEGETYEVNVLADTNSNTTATAIRAAINAIMPAVSVVATGATNVVILTAELAGKGFTTSVGLVSGTISRLALVHTTGGVTTDIARAFAGVSIYTYDEQQLAIASESAEYSANSGVSVLDEGRIWVANTETITDGGDVWIEVDGSGSNAGKFYAASSATRIKIPRSILKWNRGDHAAAGAWSASDGDVAQLAVKVQ